MFLISGATGHIGQELVNQLHRSGVPVRALVRGQATVPDGVELAVGDLSDPASLSRAFDEVTAAFLLPGFADMPALVALARRAGVDRLVLLSGPSADGGDRANAVSEYMMRSEDAVRAGRVPWTIIRPSGFMSNTLGWRDQLVAGETITAPFAEVPVACIDPADIAAVAARALTTDHHHGSTLRITGPQALRPGDQVRILAEVLGRDLEFVAQTDADAWAEMTTTMPIAYAEAFFDFNVTGSLDDSRVLPTVREVTGAEPRTYRDYAMAHRDDFSTTG